jgi:predicted ATP-grasp superfamily ATP-dependent carboligase
VQTRRVPGSGVGIEFDPDALIQLVDEFAPGTSGLVIGTGFESDPTLLNEIATDRELYGNNADIIAKVKEPSVFFPLLDALDIPHPEISLATPDPADGWLIKKIGGSGGTHIRPVTKEMKAQEGYYFQRIVPGQRASVLFLADGSQAQIVGFNEQLSTGIDNMRYWYAGAVNRLELSPLAESKIRLKLNELVHATGLVGLNGVDFIISDNDYQVLEINPRPPATIDLHDADYPASLFHFHLQACKGRLPEVMPESQEVRGHSAFYAPYAFTVPNNLLFPEWCSEIPEAGSEFSKADPVCNVTAHGKDVSEVKRQLAQRQAMIENAILQQVQ